MPAVVHDWPEHTRLTEGDSIETVRVVDPVEALHIAESIARDHYAPMRAEVEKNIDDGARLDTYQARRLRTITDIIDDLEKGLTRAASAKDGAASIGYFQVAIAKLDDMIAAGHEARDLISMFEEEDH